MAQKRPFTHMDNPRLIGGKGDLDSLSRVYNACEMIVTTLHRALRSEYLGKMLPLRMACTVKPAVMATEETVEILWKHACHSCVIYLGKDEEQSIKYSSKSRKGITSYKLRPDAMQALQIAQ
eukprot:scaffold75058_cov19-Tisochrysis_lutea.AAC.2